jgi:hypothetical protein
MFAPSVDTRIDWFRLIVELKNEGYSLSSVSHFTEISKSSLVGFKQGSQPKYHDGVRLLKFWAQATCSSQADAPTINPFSFMA